MLDVVHNSFATRPKVRSDRKYGIRNQITNKTSNAKMIKNFWLIGKILKFQFIDITLV